MTAGGKCMTSCSKSEQDDFASHFFPQSCAWYDEHKDAKCAVPGDGSSSSHSSEADSSEPASGSSDSKDGAAVLSPSVVSALIVTVLATFL